MQWECSFMTRPDDDDRVLSEVDSLVGLGLAVTALAYYLSPGAERAKLADWMDRQALVFEGGGFPPDAVVYFRRFVASLRQGEGAELLKSAHLSDDGPH
jgi:hypothetical protein